MPASSRLYLKGGCIEIKKAMGLYMRQTNRRHLEITQNKLHNPGKSSVTWAFSPSSEFGCDFLCTRRCKICNILQWKL
ncbi:hypothetical protein TSUD_336660 [Trifolium subterraneum]|uniref:Uncharacterized protein n=1 Tax=Trifolium subterraneum TaxID=3900 RepID=A0A2Z6LXH5_TRISU|nr:hypothetical protein TSUD_336660 [Trifolium subterraneum]